MVLFAYLRERFPIPPYALLVALFYAAGASFSTKLGGGQVLYWAAPIVLFAFFHLRVFDEHKDYAKDLETHPERLLSRGVVTLRMLKIWGAVAILAQIGLAAAAGPDAVAAWGAMFVFTLAMRVEFGIGTWLNRHILLYALTHNPVVGLLAVLIWATTGATWDNAYLWFVAAVSFGSLGLEIGRKTRLQHEEVPGVASYSSEHGRLRAGLYVYSCIAMAASCTVVAMQTITDEYLPALPALLGVVVGRAFTRETVPAKRVELGASLALLLNFSALTWAAVGFG